MIPLKDDTPSARKAHVTISLTLVLLPFFFTALRLPAMLLLPLLKRRDAVVCPVSAGS
jgi:hypothetical protein